MSLYFEWTLSLWLRPDTPDAGLSELRWHVGLEPGRPDKCTFDGTAPALPESQDGKRPACPAARSPQWFGNSHSTTVRS